MRRLIPALCCCALLSGCAQERIVDRINILQNMGVDVDGDTFKLSASFPKYGKAPGQQSPITAESQVMYGVFTALTAKSGQPVEIGQMRTLVISDAFAAKFLSELADLINRQFIKSSNATIVVTEQRASAVIADAAKEPPYFLSKLIEQNMRHGNMPRTNYHTFINQYYGEGQDVYLPVIHENQGELKMDGLAVFRGDRLKLRLNRDEALFVKLLQEQALTGEYDFKDGQGAMYSFVILHGKRRMAMREGKAAISLQLKIQLREMPKKSIGMQKANDMQEIRKRIEEKLSSSIQAMLVRLQKNNADPIGFGEQYRRRHRAFSETRFYNEIYPKASFDVKTKITILHAGVGE